MRISNSKHIPGDKFDQVFYRTDSERVLETSQWILVPPQLSICLMAAGTGIEAQLKTTRQMWNFNDLVMLVLVMVNLFGACHCEVVSADTIWGKYVDPSTTLTQLQAVIEMVEAEENYYPGLVAFMKWQDPVKKSTVTGRVLLWTPTCSMEARDGEYTASGKSIRLVMAGLLKGTCSSTIKNGPYWVTCIEGNMWLEYFSGDESQSKVSIPPRLRPESVHLAANNSKVSKAEQSKQKDCIPHPTGEEIFEVDSLISNINGAQNVLHADQYVMSSDKRYMVKMQADCNLVVYPYPGEEGTAYWASNTQGAGKDCTAWMQVDGNMVVYDGDFKALWSSQSYIQSYVGSFRFTMQTDGYAVVYNMESRQILWGSY